MRSGSSSGSDPASELREQVRALEQQRNEMVRAAEMNMMSTGVMQNVDTSYYDRQIADLNTQIASFRTGSKGFMDFGIGTPAMLHGIEAVVPRNTAAGQFLAANFTDNWEPIMKSIAGVESSAISQASSQPIIVTNAPTIAPVNNNIRGATNVSNQRISGVGMSDASGSRSLRKLKKGAFRLLQSYSDTISSPSVRYNLSPRWMGICFGFFSSGTS
jgi:hypothetical protein